MPPIQLRRQVQEVGWGGSKKTEILPLPTDAGVDTILLDLRFLDTISGGTTSGTVLADAVARIISGIRLVAGGKNFLKNLTARQVWNAASFYLGTDPEHTPPTAGDAGAYTCAVQLPLECTSLRAVGGELSRLETGAFRDLHLEIDFEQATSMFDATHDRSHAITLDKLRVFYYQPAGPGRTVGRWILQETQLPWIYASALTKHQEKLTTGPAYRRLLFHSIITSTGLESNTKLTELALVANDSLNLYRGSFLALRGDNKARFQRETLQTGWGALELLQRGNIRTAPGTERTNSFKLEFDTAADHTLTVVAGAYVPYPIV